MKITKKNNINETEDLKYIKLLIISGLDIDHNINIINFMLTKYNINILKTHTTSSLYKGYDGYMVHICCTNTQLNNFFTDIYTIQKNKNACFCDIIVYKSKKRLIQRLKQLFKYNE